MALYKNSEAELLDVIVCEVGPRDGLQYLDPIETYAKIKWIDTFSAAGFREIEVVSFVSPKYVPQMADSDKVARGFKRYLGTQYIALVPNLQGYADAAETDMPAVGVFISANEEHNYHNLRASIKQTKQSIRTVVKKARQWERGVRAVIPTVWGYHKRSDTPVENVLDLTRYFIELGADEIIYGDTEGVALPGDISAMMKRIYREFPELDGGYRTGLHLHTTSHHDMMAKVDKGLDSGIRIFDSSTGGIGGCDRNNLIANADTSQLLDYLDSHGIRHGINIDVVERAEAESKRFPKPRAGKR